MNKFRFMTNMRRFLNVAKELSLKDLPLSGGSFTWCGGLILKQLPGWTAS